jgi:hypothetical protein
MQTRKQLKINERKTPLKANMKNWQSQNTQSKRKETNKITEANCKTTKRKIKEREKIFQQVRKLLKRKVK